MVMKVRHYADGGKVELPPKETRVIKPTPLPPPKSGPKPKKIKRYADGGKVTSGKPTMPRPRPTPATPKAPPKPDTRERRSTIDIMRGKTRREQEMALGLKDGGKVKRR